MSNPILTALASLGDFVALAAAGLDVETNLQTGKPVDLNPLAAAGLKLLGDFHIKLPDWANHVDAATVFLQGGLNAVIEKYKPTP